MPAMNFPSSPTNGQAYGQYVYDSTKGAWRVLADLIASAVPSPTAPTSPVSGDLWFNSNDGVLFMFFNDGNTSQWVEMKSNTASGSTVAARVDAIEAKPAGLVAIIPTSVAVSSGSASVGNTGLVTVTANAGNVSLNGVFTSAYTNYRIVIEVAGSNNDVYLHARMRANSADDTVNNYHSGGYQGWSNNTSGTWSASPTTMFFWGLIAALSSGPVPVTVEISNPALTTYTKAVTLGVVSGSSSGVGAQMIGSAVYTGTSYDGITFYMGSGNVAAGTRIKIYGYR